ncbi:MAG: hypothetical protein CMJ83_12545 [Planctomycetes bacterium]|nr:hypothetical protein [Planctomycetota bacterium]
MDKVDQFESLFRSATKPAFEREEVPIASVLVAADGSDEEAEAYGDRVRSFLDTLGANVHWRDVGSDGFPTINALHEILEAEQPDLICTHRHLASASRRWQSTLGEYLDVLTQTTDTPVLVLPHPGAEDVPDFAQRDTSMVMALTNHLPGDGRLVNTALRLTRPQGTLALCHIEDDLVFERYMEVISRIPDVDTDLARETIHAQLEKEPRDWITSVKQALDTAGVHVRVQELVVFGHHLKTCLHHVKEQEAGLVVIHTKDEDQSAMHGLAYPLAIDLRDTPLLMA